MTHVVIQLSPSIPLDTPKGPGLALFLIDYGSEHHLMWTVAIDATGEIWTFENPQVRADKNYTLGRRQGQNKKYPVGWDVIKEVVI